MKVGLMLRELHGSENALARELLKASDRHAVDHDVYYLGRDLAGWSLAHVRAIARIALAYGERLDPEPAGEPGPVARARDEVSELLGRSATPGLLLLRDVRGIYVAASGVSVDWELLGQAAQGLKDRDLLAVVQQCHPETVRQVRWANSKLKESATQVLIS